MNQATKLILGMFILNIILAVIYFQLFGQYRVFLPIIAFIFPLFNIFLTPAYKLGLAKMEELYGTENRYKNIKWFFKEDITKANFGLFYKRLSYAVAVVFSLAVSFLALFLPFVKAGQNLSFYEILPMLIPMILIAILVVPAMLFICRNYKRYID